MIFDEDRIRDTYLDRYDGVQAEISQVTSFDESTDLSTTYLGKTDMTREYVIKAEEKFPISGQGYTNVKLLDQTKCTILIDTGVSKSYVKIPLQEMQITPCTSKVHLNNTKNTSR